MVWSSNDAIAPVVFRFQDKMTSLPVINKSDEPLVLRKGVKIGELSTDKWKVRWEDAEPTMLGDNWQKFEGEKRNQLLYTKIST